jgi:predicted MFS family arabinose efflux permease
MTGRWRGWPVSAQMPEPATRRSGLAFWRNSIYVLGAATVIVMFSFGMRQTFGLFMAPVTSDMGWGRESFSFAIAIQALVIGLAAPFIAATADKWGPIRVIMVAGLVYALGVALMTVADDPTLMTLSAGVVAGLGVSGCGLALLLSVVGRVASEERRSLWLGIVTAGGTAGQMVVVPLIQWVMAGHGWRTTLIAMACLAAAICPLAFSLSSGSAEALRRQTKQSLGEAIREASGHRGYWLLVAGFYVCGFQVQAIGAHLPAYLSDSGLGAALGATAIATIGFFNMIGTWGAGWLGGRYRKKYLLCALYLLRALAIVGFIFMPLSETSVVVFAAGIGLLWLGTVPLTSGIVVQLFGTRYMATLFSVVYLSHQLGSFTGVWLGGKIYDLTGSYDSFWWTAVAMGVFAALVHFPIDDRPAARLAQRAA